MARQPDRVDELEHLHRPAKRVMRFHSGRQQWSPAFRRAAGTRRLLATPK